MGRLTKAERAEREQEKTWAVDRLHEILPEGSRVGTVTIHGRGSRDWVECFAAVDGNVERITYYVARACDYGLTDKGIPRDGYQYDKSHDVVSTLAWRLYGRSDALTRDRLLG